MTCSSPPFPQTIESETSVNYCTRVGFRIFLQRTELRKKSSMATIHLSSITYSGGILLPRSLSSSVLPNWSREVVQRLDIRTGIWKGQGSDMEVLINSADMGQKMGFVSRLNFH